MPDPLRTRLARREAFERGLGVPVVQVSQSSRRRPLLCRNIYSSPPRVTTMAVRNQREDHHLLPHASRPRFPFPTRPCAEPWKPASAPSLLRLCARRPRHLVARFLAATDQHHCGAAVIEPRPCAVSSIASTGIVLDVAAFTNLQHDHLDYYGDMETYFAAKALLFYARALPARRRVRGRRVGRRLADRATVPVTTRVCF